MVLERGFELCVVVTLLHVAVVVTVDLAHHEAECFGVFDGVSPSLPSSFLSPFHAS